MNVAVVSLYVTVPVTPAMVNVAVVMVEAFIVSLNVTVIVLFTSTPVAPLAGIVDEMVGGVVSEVEPVVNVHV